MFQREHGMSEFQSQFLADEAGQGQPAAVHMYSVNATPTAASVLAKVPGLQARVAEVLHGILATAEEIHRLPGRTLDLRGHLRVQVAGHTISYVLDLDQRTAKVLFVERTRPAETKETPVRPARGDW
jgi:hypothetical protein